jgi:hypothetical protein
MNHPGNYEISNKAHLPFQARVLPLPGMGLIDLLLRAAFSPALPTGTPRRASNPTKGLLRPRVARAQNIVRPYPSPPIPIPLF